MDIVTFRTFLAAAQTGSFAGAAKQVNASPSSVTERIKQLEHRLGATLFERDKRGCRLTPAGHKFMRPARQAVRAWEFARHDIALPAQFQRSLAFGGQYLLWEQFLLGWLAHARERLPDLGLQVTAGAWARLNRDLSEGTLDMIVVHDPVFRADMGSEPLFDDELVLVTGGDPADWRANFVRIDWGQSLGSAIASRLDVAPRAGLVLDLGRLSAHWLARHQMAGFMPLHSVTGLVVRGDLSLVEGAPRFAFPTYACWRRNVDEELIGDVLQTLRESIQSV